MIQTNKIQTIQTNTFEKHIVSSLKTIKQQLNNHYHQQQHHQQQHHPSFFHWRPTTTNNHPIHHHHHQQQHSLRYPLPPLFDINSNKFFNGVNRFNMQKATTQKHHERQVHTKTTLASSTSNTNTSDDEKSESITPPHTTTPPLSSAAATTITPPPIKPTTEDQIIKMSLLSDKAIIEHIKRGNIIIKPFVMDYLSTSRSVCSWWMSFCSCSIISDVIGCVLSYDVTLGPYYYREVLIKHLVQCWVHAFLWFHSINNKIDCTRSRNGSL